MQDLSKQVQRSCTGRGWFDHGTDLYRGLHAERNEPTHTHRRADLPNFDMLISPVRVRHKSSRMDCPRESCAVLGNRTNRSRDLTRGEPLEAAPIGGGDFGPFSFTGQ